ncbi:T9SS type A sorting domain-containing protein [Pontibacter sp. E15-1]|uniref:T9SS type A sorting domain-containing protein n=1 Tax=Pontibacter sp. E15-1 TaxID=2919918 RepID=UPI001F4FF0D2|nr:T9SS type A sorting domain-containing protein [Pontibacter sp. E15-1]MCJ8165422.1 T9SS type A sorting domain-containing protein [Pontibacter sp. E15-1]
MHKLYTPAATLLRSKLTLFFFTLLFLASHTHAADNPHMIPITLAARVQAATLVVEGEVISQQAFWDARHENIYTSNIIQLYKTFKGSPAGQRIELITEGGAIGLKKHVFSTALQLKPGQQGLFFLAQQQEFQRTPGSQFGSTKAYGSQQGFVKYRITENKAMGVFDRYESVQALYQQVAAQTGQTYRTLAPNLKLDSGLLKETKQQQAQADIQAPVITSFSPTTANAGVGAVLTINGTGFGATRGSGAVEFKNADDGGQTFVRPLAVEYISWTDRQIKLFIPSTSEDGGTPGSGVIQVVTNADSKFSSVTPITIEFAYSNIDFEDSSFRPILVDKDGLGGYSIQFAPSMLNRQPAQEGFRRAMNTWVCVSGVNWKLGEPTQLETAADDGVNVIRFASSSTTGAGVLARTISRYEGCSNGQDTLFWVSEFDMEINSSISWQYGPGAPVSKQFDFETVMLHELGHAHQLSHVILSRAVMHYAIEFEVLVRDLSSADIVGGNIVMANSLGENFCEEPPMQVSEEGQCNLAPEIVTLQASFTGTNAVTVDWTSKNERVVANYVVQRSPTGTEWTDVGTVSAKGPNSGTLSYSFVDDNPLPDIAYYRLRVVYNNGSFSYSPRVRVINPSSLRSLRVYPNPINEENNTVTLLYLVENTATLDAQLYDMSGKLIHDYALTFRDVNLPVELDVSNLPAGMYILKWAEKSRNGQVKILKR